MQLRTRDLRWDQVLNRVRYEHPRVPQRSGQPKACDFVVACSKSLRRLDLQQKVDSSLVVLSVCQVEVILNGAT